MSRDKNSSLKRKQIILKSGSDIVAEVGSMLLKDTSDSMVSRKGSQPPSDFSDYVVIFPNRRPLYYLVNFLARKIKKPFFPPQTFSIGEVVNYVSSYVNPSLSDALRLDKIFLLHEAVSSTTSSTVGSKLPMEFSSFALWAPRIIEILEEMEMTAVDYSRLKSISMTSEIPSGIADIIARLPDIKDKYYELLAKHNRASYSVRLKIAISQGAEVGRVFPSVKKFYLCGFIQLTPLEEIFVNKLSEGSADVMEVSVSQPSSWLEPDDNNKQIYIYSAFDTHSQVKKVREIINGEDTIGKIPVGGKTSSVSAADTAVVVPRPDTLIPLLSEGLKGWEGKYNVSLGYPISRTPIHSFFTLLMNIEETRTAPRRELRLADYLAVADHPYTRAIFLKKIQGVPPRGIVDFIDAEILGRRRYVSEEDILKSVSDEEARKELQMMHRALFEPFREVNTIGKLAKTLWDICSLVIRESPAKEHPFADEFFTRYASILRQELPLSLIADRVFEKKEMMFDLFNSIVESETLPFPGIPLEGLQILGLLEARNLNFRKLVVMDVNEGIIPGFDPYDPILPPTLRKILGLPTYRDRENLFRRNFMSMLAAVSEEIHLIYRASTRDERSRYIEEIIWEKEKKSRKVFDEKKEEVVKPVSVSVTVPVIRRAIIEKNPSEYPRIISGEITLSASAIDRYVHCPASFYYYHILGLREDEREEILWGDGGTSAAGIGECVHEILKDFFKAHPLKKDLFSQDVRKKISSMAKKYIEKHFGELTGEVYLLAEVAAQRLSGQFIDYELSRGCDFTVIGTEEKFSSWFYVDKKNKIRIEGRVDRIDKRDDSIWLIDYKTGGFETPSHRDLANLGESIIGDRKLIKKKIKSFQLPIYVWLYYNHTGGKGRKYPFAAYYSLKSIEETLLFKETGNPPDYMMDKVYLPALKSVISEIFDVSKPFEPDDEDDVRCQRCPYQTMCARS